MGKVFVVEYDDGEETGILDVYSTRQDAENAIAENTDGDDDILEFNIVEKEIE